MNQRNDPSHGASRSRSDRSDLCTRPSLRLLVSAAVSLLAFTAPPALGESLPPVAAPTTAVELEVTLLDALRAVRGATEIVLPFTKDRAIAMRFEPVDVLAPGAMIVDVQDGHGEMEGMQVAVALAPPRLTILRGRGDDGSRAFIALGPGTVHGWIEADGAHRLIGGGRRASRLAGRELPTLVFDPAEIAAPDPLDATMVCHAGDLPGYAEEAAKPWNVAPAPAEGGVADEPPCRTAAIAIETDHEFLGLFDGDTEQAAAYALLLIAASSEIFAPQTNVHFEVNFIRLWSTASDPWDSWWMVDQLLQFTDWWLEHSKSIPRSVAHFLSGRNLGGGAAFLPGTCDAKYGFGLSAGLAGDFPYPLKSPSDDNWDVIVVTHELGHNFGAPHTHDMVPPVDLCSIGFCDDAASGTIMSYCHLCPGWLTNVNLVFAPESAKAILAHLDSAGGSCIPTGAVPLVADDAPTATEGVAATVDVLANDFIGCDAPLGLGAFDAITIAGGSVSLCAGCGAEGRDALSYEPPKEFVGLDGFTYEAVGPEGSNVGLVTIDVKPTFAPAVVSPIVAPGLAVDYFYLIWILSQLMSLPDFSTLEPYASGTVPAIDFPSTNGNFATSGKTTVVGAVFEGFITVPTTGFYTLFLESDEGSRWYVDDELVVDNDGLHLMLEQSGTVGLAAGKHAVRIEYFERNGPAGLIARIEGPNMPKQVVPASMWSHQGTADLNLDGAVDSADLGLLLTSWGSAEPVGDLNGDGVVGTADLGLLLAAWG